MIRQSLFGLTFSYYINKFIRNIPSNLQIWRVWEIEEIIDYVKTFQQPSNNPIINKSYQNKIDTLRKILEFYQNNGNEFKVREFVSQRIALINEISEDKDGLYSDMSIENTWHCIKDEEIL